MTKPWKHQPWAEPYRRAVLEMNPAETSSRIKAAQSAIENRIAELGTSQGDSADVGEWTALNNAIRILQLLQKEQRKVA